MTAPVSAQVRLSPLPKVRARVRGRLTEQRDSGNIIISEFPKVVGWNRWWKQLSKIKNAIHDVIYLDRKCIYKKNLKADFLEGEYAVQLHGVNC